MDPDADRLRAVLLGEVQTCASHTKHGRGCNCERTVDSVLHRIRSEGYTLVKVPSVGDRVRG